MTSVRHATWPLPQLTPPDWQASPSLPAVRRGAVPVAHGSQVTARDGDVLIRQRPGSKPTFALSALPGLDQVAFPSMADATRAATAYARQHGVDVWGEEGPGRLAHLSRFRPEAGGNAPGRVRDRPVPGAAGTSPLTVGGA